MQGVNGNQQIQVNPVEVARVALGFMQRVQFNASERPAFDAVEAMLNAIVKGDVQLAQPPPPVASINDQVMPAVN